MDPEIKEVKQKISEVEQEIKDVEGRQTNAAPSDVAYLRKKEEQLRKKEDRLRKKEEQLREEKLLLLLRADNSEGDSPAKKRNKSLDEAGSPSGVQAMEKLPDDHPMFRFVKSLPQVRADLDWARTESGFVIRLPRGVLWMGNYKYFSNELFVRRSYIDLKEAHLTLKRGDLTIFTGTPGIGKSHLAALMVAEFLIDGKVVLLETSLSMELQHIYYRLQLCEDGSATVHRTYNRMTALKALEELRVGESVGEDKWPVYVVDGGYPSLYDDFTSKQCEKFVFGSPRMDYKKIQRKNAAVLVLYVPLFDLAELLECAKAVTCFQGIEASVIRESFAFAGGVARTVLQNQISSGKSGLENWKKVLEEVILNNPLRSYVAQIGTGGFPAGSDMIFHWIVPEVPWVVPEVPDSSRRSEYLEKYTHKFLGFASPRVASLVFLVLGMQETEEIARLCMMSSGTRKLAATRGYWFEHLAHIKLMDGGTFKCRLLGQQAAEFLLKLPRSTFYMFDSSKEAATMVEATCTAYCRPISSSFPVVDSLSSPVLYFQMAFGKEHGIMRTKIKEFVQIMSEDSSKLSAAWGHLSAMWPGPTPQPTMPLLLFVTEPSSYEDGFKDVQKYFDGTKRHRSQDPIVQQAVLKLPIHLSHPCFNVRTQGSDGVAATVADESK